MADVRKLKDAADIVARVGSKLAVPQNRMSAELAAKQQQIDEDRDALDAQGRDSMGFTADPMKSSAAPAVPQKPSPADRINAGWYGRKAGERRLNSQELTNMTRPLGSFVPSYDKGGDVEGDQIAKLDDGERVLTADEARAQDAQKTAGLGKIAVPANPNAPSDASPLGTMMTPDPTALRDLGSSAATPTYSGPNVGKTKGPAPGQLIPENAEKQDELQYKRGLIRSDMENAAAKGDLVALGTAKLHGLELDKQNPYGSEANHPGLLGRIEHGLAKAGNIAGNILAPGATSLIPGTDLNRAAQERGALGEIQLGEANRKDEAEIAKDKALTQAAGVPHPKEEEWSVVQGATGPNGEMVQQEKNSGQMRFAPLSGVTAKTKGNEASANDEQVAEYQSQIPAITPFLSSAERVAYAFPKGYKPTVAEIASMKKDAAAANAAALSGNREARAAATAAAANNKKSLEENVIDGAAKSIASMDVHDLSPLKDIASLRGDQRLLIYQKAKQINPNFNTAEVQRKVKMLDQFTDGKDGVNLQSFGTFFEHAGNLSQAVNDLRNFPGTAELLNKPWNWFENHTGDPRVAKFLAASEPVKKEFESFLLNNRALYESDRKSMDEVLNGDMSPAKLQAVLKTMGHTATARYTEMNQRFKNTVGTSIDDAIGPMSDESLKSAAKIGVTKIGNNVLRNGTHGYGWYQEGQ